MLIHKAGGCAHLHSNDLIHRDLHGGNVLLKFNRSPSACSPICRDDIGAVKIADLGQSCDTHFNRVDEVRSLGRCNASLAAPEMFRRHTTTKHASYGTPVDVWAIGVNLVQMLMGLSAVPKMPNTSDYVSFWTSVLGRPAPLPEGLRWLASSMQRPCKDIVLRVGGSTTRVHALILVWDPEARPKAGHVTQSFKSLEGNACQIVCFSMNPTLIITICHMPLSVYNLRIFLAYHVGGYGPTSVTHVMFRVALVV